MVLQFYPSSDDQIQLISSIAQKAGFGGGIVVDYPNSKKARKVFLCLFVGGGNSQQQVPQGLQGDEEYDSKVIFEKRRERMKAKHGKRKPAKDRDWILKKKEVIFNYCILVSTHSDIVKLSFIASGAKKTFPMTQNILVVRGELNFDHHCPCNWL